jgi:hypothetical protein
MFFKPKKYAQSQKMNIGRVREVVSLAVSAKLHHANQGTTLAYTLWRAPNLSDIQTLKNRKFCLENLRLLID